jgi:MarR family transcriptional regulator, organic hydroperoxide resistance regulator
MEQLSLNDHLCFSLYSCSRAISRMYRPLLEKLGITYPQYLVLLVLWEKRESSVKEIGEALDLDTGTLTPLLKRMEANELIKRERLKQDERVVMIKLTENGAKLQEDAMCIPLSLLDSVTMNMEQIQELNDKIKTLSEQVSRHITN